MSEDETRDITETPPRGTPKPHKNKWLDIAQRRERVAEWYLQGYNGVAIAEKLGVSANTVYNDLKRLGEAVREKATINMELARDHELAKLDRVEQEAWEAWRRSARPQRSTTTTKPKNGKVVMASVTDRDNPGEPRFLEIIQKCIEARRKLLGLDAPERNETNIRVEVEEARSTLIDKIEGMVVERSKEGAEDVGDSTE